MSNKFQNEDFKSESELVSAGGTKANLLNTTKIYSPKTTNALETDLRKNNDSAVTSPSVANDVTQGYETGSRWIDTLAQETYFCISNSTGAAIWKESGSGGGIGQAQGTRQSPLLLLANSQITPLPQKVTQVIFISGSASAITLTDLKPLKTDNMVIGQKITLVCTSDANPVTFQSTVNFILNGEATLYKDDVLQVEFIGSDGTNDSYIEIGRNF